MRTTFLDEIEKGLDANMPNIDVKDIGTSPVIINKSVFPYKYDDNVHEHTYLDILVSMNTMAYFIFW